MVPKPASLTFEEAAAIPTSGLAALHGLRDAGRLQPGQRVLVNGASGGVGTFAVQIAKAPRRGGDRRVLDGTRAGPILGADHVIDYTERRLHDRQGPIRPHPRQHREPAAVGGSPGADAATGRSCSTAGPGDRPADAGPPRPADRLSLFSRQTLRRFLSHPKGPCTWRCSAPAPCARPSTPRSPTKPCPGQGVVAGVNGPEHQIRRCRP